MHVLGVGVPFGHQVCFDQEVDGLGAQLDRLSCLGVKSKMISVYNQPEPIIVVEVPQDAPADLYFEHLDALLLQSNEPLQVDVVLLLNFQLPQDHLLDDLDVLHVELGLEHSLLQGVHLGVV